MPVFNWFILFGLFSLEFFILIQMYGVVDRVDDGTELYHFWVKFEQFQI